MKHLRIICLIVIFVFTFSNAGFAIEETLTKCNIKTVKVATVHFCPILGNVQQNVSSLLALNREAAINGAKIIVNTEMATCGYSFFSRSDIATVAETIPGPTTNAFGELATQYGVYIVLGMPEYDAHTNLYYNCAVLIGPQGNVVGTYHKRNNIMESSYNATDYGKIPVFDTPYGKIGIAICADTFYPVIPRIEAVKGVDILAVPMNGGGPIDGFKVLAFENDFSVIVANRYGEETQGVPRDVFNQNTFSIASLWPYNFNYDTHSVIINNNSEVLVDVTEYNNVIGYGEIPLLDENHFPVYRRPDLYSLMAQDTLQSYNLRNMGLPPASIFAAAAVDPQNNTGSWDEALASMANAVSTAMSGGYNLKLIVLPAEYFRQKDELGIARVKNFCINNSVDAVLHFGAETPPVSMFVTSSGETYEYKRTHRSPGENIAEVSLSNEFFVIDREYARLALLQDKDLFAPETGIVMEKMAVDVIAVNANSNKSILSSLWKTRTNDYFHLVVSNMSGKEGIYLGGYIAYPSSQEADGLVIMNINTADIRTKWEQRLVDVSPLLKSKPNSEDGTD